MNPLARLRRFLLVFVALFLMPMVVPASVSAAEPIYATVDVPCSLTGNTYIVEMEVYVASGLVFDYPNSIMLHFSNGTTQVVTTYSIPTIDGQRYEFVDSDGKFSSVSFSYADAIVDIPIGTEYRFEVTQYPCLSITPPISTVSGVVVQHGSLKPIEGATVCLQPMNFCGVTDVNGEFLLVGVVPLGEYELVSTGPKLRDLSTTVTVDQTQEYYEIIQRRGGGQ